MVAPLHVLIHILFGGGVGGLSGRGDSGEMKRGWGVMWRSGWGSMEFKETGDAPSHGRREVVMKAESVGRLTDRKAMWARGGGGG